MRSLINPSKILKIASAESTSQTAIQEISIIIFLPSSLSSSFLIQLNFEDKYTFLSIM